MVIAYKYPPYSGVGAFRWTKISKYLARLGYEIHVVTVDWEYSGPNTNVQDTEHDNIHIHRIPSGYPQKLRYTKIRNRYINFIRNVIFSRFINKYIYWDDEAQRWGKYLLPFAEGLIRSERITHVIATGHPFQANYWAAQLKKRCPSVKLIQDFRDPWVQNPSYRQSKSPKTLSKAEKYLNESLRYADLCVCVSNGLVEEYRRYDSTKKFVVITNGYDDETLQKIGSTSLHLDKAPGKIYLTHIGNVTNGRDLMLARLFDALSDDENIIFCFAGILPAWIFKSYKKLTEQHRIIDFGIVSPEEALSIVQQSDIALQVTAEKVPYALSTKVFEYAALQKPILSVNSGGDIDTLLLENQWGVSIHYQDPDFSNKVKQCIREIKPIVNISSLEKYSYKSIARQYSQLIQDV